MIKLEANERIDDLHRDGYKIIQNSSRFCFGIDAVLLSDFTRVKEKERVLDLGTGNGIIPILLKAKTKGQHFTGLEIQSENVDIARRSVELNNLEKDIEIVEGDIKEAVSIFGAASFDIVTTNPPYMTGSHGLVNDDMAKSIARHEILCNLEDVIAQSAKILKPRGRFYMIHRPFRLAEIFMVMGRYKIEPKRMQLVYPFVNKEPNMVLIEGMRDANPRISVEKPLIVYDRPGVYTRDIMNIYGEEWEKKVDNGGNYEW